MTREGGGVGDETNHRSHVYTCQFCRGWGWTATVLRFQMSLARCCFSQICCICRYHICEHNQFSVSFVPQLQAPHNFRPNSEIGIRRCVRHVNQRQQGGLAAAARRGGGACCCCQTLGRGMLLPAVCLQNNIFGKVLRYASQQATVSCSRGSSDPASAATLPLLPFILDCRVLRTASAVVVPVSTNHSLFYGAARLDVTLRAPPRRTRSHPSAPHPPLAVTMRR